MREAVLVTSSTRFRFCYVPPHAVFVSRPISGISDAVSPGTAPIPHSRARVPITASQCHYRNARAQVPVQETERSKSSPPPPPIPQNGPPIDSLGEEARGLIRKHTAFMERNGKVMVSQVVEPLAAMVHEDTNLAYHLWVLIFPIVWAALDKNQQFDLAKPIIGETRNAQGRALSSRAPPAHKGQDAEGLSSLLSKRTPSCSRYDVVPGPRSP